ncbi:MAG: sugar kinase [Oscillospiraceae bacterium]|nr:sugar kinase [Oscillospiraceae bacterium]
MERTTEQKIILVTQKTHLEQMVFRYNNPSQAKFYIESHGGDFSDYQAEHDTYQAAVQKATAFLETYARLQILDREHVPNFLFGANDLVIVLGRDGLVANVLKYLTTQRLIGVNPDAARWDGQLLPFRPEDLPKIVPEVCHGRRSVRSVTLACATLNDGQTLCGVNDLFLGQRTHTSARYELHLNGRREVQSSSGIIFSTGLGSTGWLRSILAGAAGIDHFCGIDRTPVLPSDFGWGSDYLYFTVREPFPSRSTGASIVFGKIEKGTPMQITSLMPENGIIFSDGIEQDCLDFNAGAKAVIGIADRKGNLVI